MLAAEIFSWALDIVIMLCYFATKYISLVYIHVYMGDYIKCSRVMFPVRPFHNKIGNMSIEMCCLENQEPHIGL